MPLDTVSVPREMEPLFARAEQIVSRYFRDRKHDPAHGTIEIFGERYVLVRAASLSVEFFRMVEDMYGAGREAEADEFARNILFDLAHAVGKSDAQNFHAKMGLVEPIARLSAGPVHFAHSGWAYVDIAAESRPSPDESYYLLYDHPYSFESDAWLRAQRPRQLPTCIMNAGYSSGWCEESFGVTLVAAEVLCRACGDECCRFIMAHPSRIDERVRKYLAGRAGGRATSPQVPDFFSRKRMEEELRRARDELERRVEERTRELKESNDRLRLEIAERQEVEKKLLQRHKLEAVGRLAGGIAHDFNNLMAVILNSCGLLDAGLPSGDARRQQVEDIAAAGEHAAALTRQLLTFSRAQIYTREIVDLNQIVRDLGSMLERVIGEDVELVTILSEASALVESDRGQLEQVVMNLAVNARDAMPAGGRLSIETRVTELDDDAARASGLRPGRYLALVVTDSGVGMDETTQQQMFDPFFTTKEDGKGTGLGLSTVYGIVRQHGGTISVDSAPARGARFTVLFPSADERTPSALPPAREHRVATGHETVLLVEDQERLRTVLAEVLKELGYRVLTAKSGEEALDIVAAPNVAIDALVSDVVMARIGGPELATRMRALRPNLPILLMSGYADDAQLSAMDPQPAFLQKPFRPGALAAKLRELLDRAEAPP